jgi:hypothetical protein
MVGSGFARLRKHLAWRLTRLREALFSVNEIVFWVGETEGAPWYPDVDKLAEIGRMSGLSARTASTGDLDLFRRYHARCGRHLGPRRRRLMKQRWARGDQCYIALDGEGEIVAQFWVAYYQCLIEGRMRQVGPDEGYAYALETRPDRRSGMEFVACTCAALADGLRIGRSRAISWGVPSTFESFRRLNQWAGLHSAIRPLRLERWTRLCGIRFCRTTELDESWVPPRRVRDPR